ncbi:MAG: SurA N-terminal domain-containing protein [Spirochaetes bacterium]|nr:SurA N-terminal domain-containing protein [Spirochaetota bacterium]
MKKIVLLISLFSVFLLISARLDIGQDKLVKINDKTIYTKDFEKYYNTQIKLHEQLYFQQYGRPLPESEKPTKKIIMQNLIQDELLKDELSKSKTFVMDENILKSTLQTNKDYYTKFRKMKEPDYQFNETDFKAFVESEYNNTYEEYEKSLKEKLMVQQYIMKKSEPVIQQIIAKKYDSPRDFPVIIPNPQTGTMDKYFSLLEFYERNPTMFVRPKTVELKHIFIYAVDQDEKGKLVKMQDSRYEAQKAKANDIYSRLSKGEKSFDELCLAYSDDVDSRDFKDPETKKPNPGYLGPIAFSGELVPEYKRHFGEELFSKMFDLPKNKISQVYEGVLGFHIFYVIDKKEGALLKFDEIKPKLVDIFKEYEKTKAVSDELDSLVESLRAKASITYFNDEYKL